MNDYYVNGYYARRPWYSSVPFDSRFVQALRREPTERPDYRDYDSAPAAADYPEGEALLEEYGSSTTEGTPAAAAPSAGYEQTAAPDTVSEYSITDAVNLREAVLVSLGGAGAALALLTAMAALLLARRRKSGSSPSPTPPILVYPPHDLAAPCFLTKEVNFSLPAMRSCSMGELREEAGGGGGGEGGSSGALAPSTPHLRSNSFIIPEAPFCLRVFQRDGKSWE